VWRALPGQARQQPLPFRRLLAEPGSGLSGPPIPDLPALGYAGEDKRRLGFFHSSGLEVSKGANESQAPRLVRTQRA
jgi:hypothetical protein